MNEHDDDVEPEVEEGNEFEHEEFPILTDDDEETEAGDAPGTDEWEREIDPDKSELQGPVDDARLGKMETT